jgi:hypothetical protein
MISEHLHVDRYPAHSIYPYMYELHSMELGLLSQVGTFRMVGK